MNRRTKKNWIMMICMMTSLVLISCTAIPSASSIANASTASREASYMLAPNSKSADRENPSTVRKNQKNPTGYPLESTTAAAQTAVMTTSGTLSTATGTTTSMTATTAESTAATATTTAAPAVTTAPPTTTLAPPTPTTNAPTTVMPTVSTTTGAAPTTAAPTTVMPTTTQATTTASPPTSTAAPTTTTTTAKPTTTTATPTTTAPTSSVSVKTYGAVGDGRANDTAAIQRALNTATAEISIPDGVYMVDATIGVKPMSNQTLRLSPGAVLRAIPTSSAYYNVIRIDAVSNVEISGGMIQGDRNTHTGTSGEHGMGIAIGKGANNIRIRNMTIRDCWGDGIYIGCPTTGIARNILVDGVTCDNNRRQGLSITQAEYVTVRNSVFKNTKGIAPQCGLDIEPNPGGQVRHVVIENSQFLNNAVYGLIINAANGPADDVLVKDNIFSGNVNAGFAVSNSANATNIHLAIKYGTTAVNAYEYSQCYGLDRVTIPSTVTTIGNNAFQAAYSLTSVTIPSSVTRIAAEAFKYCTSLESVRIPASVTAIDNVAFLGCSNLRSAYFYGNAPVTTNALFYKCALDLRVYFIAGKSGFTLPTWRGYPTSTFIP